MSRTFKAIVFDFDGLIVDTELPEYEERRKRLPVPRRRSAIVDLGASYRRWQ